MIDEVSVRVQSMGLSALGSRPAFAMESSAYFVFKSMRRWYGISQQLKVKENRDLDRMGDCNNIVMGK